jgi:hypothetical protein
MRPGLGANTRIRSAISAASSMFASAPSLPVSPHRPDRVGQRHPGSSTRRRSALPRYRWLPARWPPRPEEGDQPRPRPFRGCSAVSRQRRSEGPTRVSGGRCGDAAAKVASAPALLFTIAATLPAGMTGGRAPVTSPAESLPIRGGWSGLDPGRRDSLPTMRGGRRAESGARPDPVHHGLLASVRCEIR